MADESPQPQPRPRPLASKEAHGFWENEEIQQWGRPIGIVLAVALALFFGYNYYSKQSHERALKSSRALGPAYGYLERQQLDSAAEFLSAYLSEGQTDLAESKANLLLGRIYFSQGEFTKAMSAYRAVRVGSKHPLIGAGARHGIAAVLMEQEKWQEAAGELQSFVNDYQRESAEPGKGQADLSPVVPDVLWKLALVQRELGNAEKAKEALNSLMKTYPQSQEAREAGLLLAQLQS